MKKKYKIILVSAALILFALILLLVKNHANKNSNYSKIVVSDGLSINYLDGDKIVASPSKSNKYVFSITNDSTSEKYYKVDIDKFAFNENVKYTLVCKETGINYEDVNFTSSALIDYVVINPWPKVPLSVNAKFTRFGVESHYFVLELGADPDYADKSKPAKVEKDAAPVKAASAPSSSLPSGPSILPLPSAW